MPPRRPAEIDKLYCPVCRSWLSDCAVSKHQNGATYKTIFIFTCHGQRFKVEIDDMDALLAPDLRQFVWKKLADEILRQTPRKEPEPEEPTGRKFRFEEDL